jgi:hypothetical protein
VEGWVAASACSRPTWATPGAAEALPGDGRSGLGRLDVLVNSASLFESAPSWT